MSKRDALKIYIMADMEGASGIACRAQTDPSSPLYAEGRRLLTGDVNAAIQGAFRGGADEVIVDDAHGGSFNLSPEELDPRVRLSVGVPQKKPRLAGLDGSYAGVFLIAYHAMAGTVHAVLEHTMNSRAWHSVRVNGVPVGETGIDAGMAAASGVPVVMVSGDDKLCGEARALLGKIETACVKEGHGRHRAICLPLPAARERIDQAAENAVRRLAAGECFTLPEFSEPVTISVTYKHTEDADEAASSIHARRADGYTVECDYACFAHWYGGLQENESNKQRS